MLKDVASFQEAHPHSIFVGSSSETLRTFFYLGVARGSKSNTSLEDVSRKAKPKESIGCICPWKQPVTARCSPNLALAWPIATRSCTHRIFAAAALCDSMLLESAPKQLPALPPGFEILLSCIIIRPIARTFGMHKCAHNWDA